jgi:hypothetical protein
MLRPEIFHPIEHLRPNDPVYARPPIANAQAAQFLHNLADTALLERDYSITRTRSKAKAKAKARNDDLLSVKGVPEAKAVAFDQLGAAVTPAPKVSAKPEPPQRCQAP